MRKMRERKRIRWAVLYAAASFPLTAQAQFQFEIPSDFFGQQGGFEQQPQRRSRGRQGGTKVPRGISERYSWMKGTEWNWNDWREVRFEPDGTFDAPTDSCAQRQCKWSADDNQVYIRWGSDGVHFVQPIQNEPVAGNKLKGKREDGQRCEASFVKKEVNDEDLDFYEVLGVDEDADARDIKKAYRKLAILYHPDKCKGTVEVEGEEELIECQTIMNRVNTAYEVLGEEEKRILYDAGGMDLVKQGLGDERGGGGGMDPFAALFGGGGGGRRNSNRGPDAHVETPVTLEDIYNGNEVNAPIKRRVVCRGCGPGKKHKPKCDTCKRCPDETKMVQRQMGPGMIVQQEERVQSKEKCKEEETVLSLTVERGMEEGAEVKFPRMSEQSPGQVPGDVIMKLKQKRHPTFTREKNDLHMSMTITLKEALLGFSKTINHLDDHKVIISQKKITKPGFVKRVKGEGMPVHNFPSDFGDLHVKFTVQMPTSLTEEQAKAIETLF